MEDNHSPYCPVCSGCGEDGCCKASMCKMDENGSYCQSYLKDLKIGYLMEEWMMKNIFPTLTEEQQIAYMGQLEIIIDKIYEKN